MAFEDQFEPKTSILPVVLKIVGALIGAALLVFVVIRYVVPKLSSLGNHTVQLTASFVPLPSPPHATATPKPTPTSVPQETASPTVVIPEPTQVATTSKTKLPKTGPEGDIALALSGALGTGGYLYSRAVQQKYRKAARNITVLS